MENLKCKSNWYCYCILGKVANKTEALEYLNNWMKCFYVIDDFLKDCPKKSIVSEQILQTIKSIDTNGCANSSYKKAPTGGTQVFNQKNNKKICSLYLEEEYNEIVKIEKTGVDYYDWFYNQFPKRKTLVNFDYNTIKGYLSEKINIKKTTDLPDFIFELSATNNPNKFKNANTEINIYISERYYNLVGSSKTEKFISEIGEIAKAIKIGKSISTYKREWKEKNGTNRVEFVVGCNFANKETLEFSRNSRIKNWSTIFEK